mmetsp:Transcript_40527/g.84827  ORF Transcript_40527/g.84827 Transcript_40527/m.84827 type:complete len:423 (+) Transcript_40527:112-1380(+)
MATASVATLVGALLALLALSALLGSGCRLGLRDHRDLAGLGLEDLRGRLNGHALDTEQDAPGEGSRDFWLVLAHPRLHATLYLLDVVRRGDLDGPHGHLATGAVIDKDSHLALPQLKLLESFPLQLGVQLPMRCKAGALLGEIRADRVGHHLLDDAFGFHTSVKLLVDPFKELWQEEAIDSHDLHVWERHLVQVFDGVRHHLLQVLLRGRNGLYLQQDLCFPPLLFTLLGHDCLRLVPANSFLLHLDLPSLHHDVLSRVPIHLEALHALYLVLLLNLHDRLLQRLVDKHVEDGLDFEIEIEDLTVLHLRVDIDARLLRHKMLRRRFGQELIGLRLHGLCLDGHLLGGEVRGEVDWLFIPLRHGHVEDGRLLDLAPPYRLGRGALCCIFQGLLDIVLLVDAVSVATVHPLVPSDAGLLQVPVH